MKLKNLAKVGTAALAATLLLSGCAGSGDSGEGGDLSLIHI